MKLNKFLALIMAVAMLLTMTSALADEQLAEQQVLNLRYTDLALLDVNDVRNANEFLVLSQVQEGLFRTFTVDGVDEVTNAGCASYEVSEDGLTYTFTLREGMVWSDGEPVTAQNYVDSWVRLVNPESGFSYAFLAYGIVGAEDYCENGGAKEDVAVTKIDDLTFTCTLTAPDPAFLKKVSMVCFYPVRQDLIDAATANGGNWKNDYALHVWNGPFVISNRILENSMTLTKNEKYWDAENITLTQVNLRVVDEASTMAQLFTSQQLDVIELTDMEYVDQWEPYVQSGKMVHISQDAPSVTYMVIDQHPAGNGGPSGLMLSPKCRLAISLAFDREEFNDLFYEGYNTLAYSLIPNGITVGDTEFRSYAEEPLLAYADVAADPAALQAMFKEGMAAVGDTRALSDVVLTVFTYSPTTLVQSQLEWYKQTLESKLGVQVKVDIYPDVSTWKTARDSYQYDFYLMGWNGDFNDPITFMELFTTGNGYAKFMGGYSNPVYDELIGKAISSQDDAERLELFAQAEKLLMEEGGTAPFYFNQNQFYVQSYVKGVSTPLFGNELDFSRACILAH